MMRTRPHPPLTPLAVAVLELLHERDMHPYEMHQLIRDRGTDHVIKLTPGALYHTVERLARHELIAAMETARAGRRPERTVYAITEAGRDEFTDNLRDMIRRPIKEYPLFGAAVEMLQALDPQAAARLLEQRSVALEANIAAAEQLLASLLKRGLTRLQVVEIEYAMTMIRAELSWVRGIVDDIRSGALPWTRPAADSTLATDATTRTLKEKTG
jgi:DNA-binding PadR family transcriptional regulator